MKISDLLLKKEDDKTSFLAARVRRLVPAANILASSSFKPFLDRYPYLSEVSLQDWDFSVTVAATCSALMNLANVVPSESAYSRFTALLSKEVRAWNSKAEYAMGDLMSHLHKSWAEAQQLNGQDATKLLAALIGSWCMINCGVPVQREEPDPLSVEIGTYILISFRDWWTSPVGVVEEK